MKPITFVLVSVLAGLSVVAARADQNRAGASVEFRIGPNYVASSYAVPVPVYFPAPARSFVPARGHWDEVIVKTWMPGRWVTGRDRWGRTYRVMAKGYFVYRTERVWIDGSRGGVYGYSGVWHDDRNG